MSPRQADAKKWELQDSESHAAQMDGAKLELLTGLKSIFPITAKVNMVTEAEEHAEELHRVAAEIQR